MKKIVLLLCLLLPIVHIQADIQTNVLGGIFNLTGNQASLDVPCYNGFKLAFDALAYSQNTILSHLKINVANGKTDQDIIEQTAKNLYQIPHLSVIIGLSDTDMARSVAREARKSKRIFITPGVTSPLLTTEYPTYTFLVAFGDNAQAAAAAEYAIKTLNITTCAVLYDADMDYTRLIGEYFIESFMHYGGNILLKRTFAHLQPDIQDAIEQIKNSQSAMIYLAAGPEHVKALIKKIRAADIQMPIFGGDSYDLPAYSQEDNNIYYTTHAFIDRTSDDPQVVKFIDDYKKKYGVDPHNAFAALGFDACNLLTTVIQKIDSYNLEDLLKELNTIQDFKGLTGDISYSNRNHVPQKPVTIVSVMRGQELQAARFLPDYIPPAIPKNETQHSN